MSHSSVLWQFFTRIDRFYAKCNMCNNKMSYKTTTTNLKKHMLRKHPTAQFCRSMKLVQNRTRARIEQKRIKEASESQSDPYEDVILYEEKPKISAHTSEYPQVTVERIEAVKLQNEDSKHSRPEHVGPDPVSDGEYPFEEAELGDTIESRPWTPVRLQHQRPPKEKTENLVEVCQKLVKTLEAREVRDERLFMQQQSVIAKLDQTLLLVSQVLVKLNDKFDKL